MGLLHQRQVFESCEYKVLDLIEASKNLKIMELKVADIHLVYGAPNDDNLVSFVEHYKRTRDVDLSYPIILSPTNFILDGKHRLAKAIIEGKKKIKAVRFKEMPDCGEYVED